MNNILEVTGLNKNYKSFSLKNVSFTIPKGYIMGFVGPNGAGKTTTIKAILNMINYDAGDITALGFDNKKDSSQINDQIGVVMDLPFYVNDWSIKDVESAVSPFYSGWNHDKYLSMLKEFSIEDKKKVKELSRGMKVKLMLAVALSHDARLLILDEPTSGLDPVARDELMDILRDFISDENNGVLFSTHITSDLEKIADYITFIKDGTIVYSGLKDTLMESYALVKGGAADLTGEQKKLIIGLREHSSGFEGMARAENLRKLPKSVLAEPITLEEIIVYMNKGRNFYE